MKRMNVNGIEMAYEDRGQGDPVVLLHGFCGSSAYWDEIIPKLESKYRVIVPDLRAMAKQLYLKERTPWSRWPKTLKIS